MLKKAFSIFILLVLLVSLAVVTYAKNQKFISIEPHMGFASQNSLFVGGRLYTYEGISGIKIPYKLHPNMILSYKGEKVTFQPDSDGYFWVNMPLKAGTNLSCTVNDQDYTNISIDKNQKKKNNDLILVTNFGLNIDKINIPFLCINYKSAFGVISDFDDTVTLQRGLGLADILTSNPDKLDIRGGIENSYNKIHNKINPFFYVTARPVGTYKVIEDFIKVHNLPSGPIIARNLGFWFLSKGLSIVEHKTQTIDTIMSTFAGKRFILIGDNDKKDEFIYIKAKEKYKDRIIKVFIFINKDKKYVDTDYIKHVETPEEMVNELYEMGLLTK